MKEVRGLSRLFEEKNSQKNVDEVIGDTNKLTNNINENIQMFKEVFKNDGTVLYRMFENKNSTIRCCIIFIDGMVNNETVNLNIMKPIMSSHQGENLKAEDKINILLNKILDTGEAETTSNINEIIKHLVYGDTILLIDGSNEVIAINTKGFPVRSIQEPQSETVVRGPREGFTESIITNLTLIRRKVRSSDLKFKFKEVGTRTKTRVCICYIEGLTQPQVLDELETRIDSIKLDSVLDSGYIEEFIKDEPLSPFTTVGTTERPDTIVGKLLEGRIAIICDGTPIVLTVPFIFTEHFQVNEDYYNTFMFSTLNRMLRGIAFFLTTSVPAIYIALTTYHQEMIPTPLLIGIYQAREGVPFPTVIEALLMLLTFELLREAGVRLPKYIGQAVSIVGALVLGDAAVNASIISAPMVIVTAITGISSFLIPQMLGGLIITRLIFLILSSILGLYGYIFGVIGLFIHLMSMKSYGIPYMLNTNVTDFRDLQDMVVRAPWWYMNYRTKLVSKDPIRQVKGKFVRRRIK